MKRNLFAGNWKMYQSLASTEAFLKTFMGLVDAKPLPGADFAFLAQGPLLPTMRSILAKGAKSPIAWGPQSTYWETEGAFTGELSPKLAQELGCQFALSGHSERRQFFGETDASAARRAVAALKFGMVPIFCLGENLAERDGNQVFQVLERQAKALIELLPEMPARFVVAYEPVWAIGTGRTATAAQAEEAHHFLRECFGKAWGKPASERLEILYGGSVKPQNSRELLASPNIDGVLVGGASLDPNTFFDIAAQAIRC